MIVLTTLALSVSITGKSSRSSSSISSVAVGLDTVYILYSGLKPDNIKLKQILNLFFWSCFLLPLSPFTACFVKLRKAKIFDQTNKHPSSPSQISHGEKFQENLQIYIKSMKGNYYTIMKYEVVCLIVYSTVNNNMILSRQSLLPPSLGKYYIIF